ncbi:MAG: hypothetical protein P1U56_15195 [Saprospiraceae bacterium]|nr:hypothetical protein [Saprospiraceae bacterium]
MRSLQPFTPFYFLFIISISFLVISCDSSDDTGCTNSFANNFDSSAIEDCCCEFDVASLVDELEGEYNYKFKETGSPLNASYSQISFIKDPTNNERILYKDNNDKEIVGSFVDGQFLFESEISMLFKCNSKITCKLFEEAGVLKFEVENEQWQTETPIQSWCASYTFFGELSPK